MYQLILNPVENLPYLFDVNVPREIHGLYVSDKLKTDEIVRDSKIGFSGRSELNQEVQNIYQQWGEHLHAQHLSMRLLSGLHAHIILFMGLGKIGDTILLLPEIAGGHYATKKILERLGYQVVEMIPDFSNMCIDVGKTRQLIENTKPNFIFVDRSEGLYYEDFSDLLQDLPVTCGKIFDASQYLTNILEGDFPSPFDMGFDIMMSTMHKNFPGPQKALVCSRDDSIYWQRIADAMSSYVSSLHVENIILAGEILKCAALLEKYSSNMLTNNRLLEEYLLKYGIPVVERKDNRIHTHHLWLKFTKKQEAFDFYKKMETCGLLVNYRKLPYNLDMGIRMGTSAATLQGLNSNNVEQLAAFMAEIFQTKTVNDTLIKKVQLYISSFIPLPNMKGFTI